MMKLLPGGTALAAAVAAMVSLAAPAPADAETRLTLKSAAAESSYYVMMVQLAGMIGERSDGTILPTVEESQGSVQNVRESARRPGAFLFTTPPSLIDAAWGAREPFDDGGDYSGIRTLFPMPFVTIHFVVRADSGIEEVSDLAGKTFMAGGVGTFCRGRTESILNILGIADEVETPDMELSGAPAAIRNRQVDGYATCSSHPTPQLQELATTVDVRILSFSEEERAALMEQDPMSGPITIDAGTYVGQDADIHTVGVPVGAYAVNMSDEMAELIVSQFWQQREGLARENPWWAGVRPELTGQLLAPLHPGAVAYYEKAGVAIPDHMK
jgi:uncharacterized protein